MAAKTYQQKLLDPRWQRKRLEAMEKVKFTCQMCGDTESTLHVHHKQYIKGREPWEYEVAQLCVLCKDCHASSHDGEDRLSVVCSFADVDGPESRDSIADLVSGYMGRPWSDDITDPELYVLGVLVEKIYLRKYNIPELYEWAISKDFDVEKLAEILGASQDRKAAL